MSERFSKNTKLSHFPTLSFGTEATGFRQYFPHTGTTGAPKTGPQLEEKGLYMLLVNLGPTIKCHWALCIAMDDTSGLLFQQALFGMDWKFIMENNNVILTDDPLGALKLGSVESIDDEWLKRITQCLRGTVIEGEFTCRTWALAALYELANEGFIGMIADWGTIREIEQEAQDLVLAVWTAEQKIVRRSQFYSG